jgi:hypothetical protein
MVTTVDSWVAHPGHYDVDEWSDDALINSFRQGSMRLIQPTFARYHLPVQGPARVGVASSFSAHTFGSSAAPDSLRQRLDNANRYFHRKAAEVFSDDVALRLLAAIYQVGVIDLADFDSCEYGVPLAKLTAANFCEIGARVIYVTESGQRFIESIG